MKKFSGIVVLLVVSLVAVGCVGVSTPHSKMNLQSSDTNDTKIIISGVVEPGVVMWLAKSTPKEGSDYEFVVAVTKIPTDKAGRYATQKLSKGVYVLTPRKPGFRFEPPMATFDFNKKGPLNKPIIFRAIELSHIQTKVSDLSI